MTFWVAGAVVLSTAGSLYATSKASSAQGKAAQLQAQTAKDTLTSQQAIAAPYTTAGAYGVNELARQLGVGQ